MTTEFNVGFRPSDKQLLDYAADIGLEIEPGSLKETEFLLLCTKLYSVGYRTGMDLMYRAAQNRERED